MRTLELPDSLDDCVLETYHVAYGQNVRAGMPLVTVDGQPVTVPVETDGVVLYHFLSQDDRCGGGVERIRCNGCGNSSRQPASFLKDYVSERCKFCEADVYLPEDLWRHLHPSAKRGRWWLLLRP